METAIKRAIEGGYKDNMLLMWCDAKGNDAPLLIDPLFWQALGKAEGWRGYVEVDVKEHMKHESSLFKGLGWDVWQYQMHCFIDHLAEGKGINSFFEELLKE